MGWVRSARTGEPAVLHAVRRVYVVELRVALRLLRLRDLCSRERGIAYKALNNKKCMQKCPDYFMLYMQSVLIM